MSDMYLLGRGYVWLGTGIHTVLCQTLPQTKYYCLYIVCRYYPTTNGDMQKWKLTLNIYTKHIHVFACSTPICMLSRFILTEFLHQSSVGDILRVRCWLGGLTNFAILTNTQLLVQIEQHYGTCECATFM